MGIDEVVAHFGSKKNIASALGVTPSAVSLWGREIPALRQFQIQMVTDGELKAKREDRPNLNKSSTDFQSCAPGPDGNQ